MIRFEAVTKRYGDTQAAVTNLNLEIAADQVTILVGPSGCGKTTTLRMINRLADPSSGRVTVHGQDVVAQDPRTLRLGMGYVMQSAGLFPHRTVRENIATVPRLLGWDRRRIQARVDELVDLVSLRREILSRYPHQLSGGQQQRVGVARALAADPPILLMDEPFGAVDPVVREHLQQELLALQARVRKTIVFVTHDVDEALRLGDEIVVFGDGGRIIQQAAPGALLANPADTSVRSFLGEDRELRRLALVSTGTVAPEPGPVIHAGDSSVRAQEAAAACDTDWVVVLDSEGSPLGWARLDALEAIEPFRYTVQDHDSLRSALNAIVITDIGAVPRVDDAGRYVGMISRQSLRGVLA